MGIVFGKVFLFIFFSEKNIRILYICKICYVNNFLRSKMLLNIECLLVLYYSDNFMLF